MRHPSHISPSQLSLYYRDRESYYLQHLSETRSQNNVRTHAMTIGSAFDAYVKSAMYEHLFGQGSNQQFEFEDIIEDQVAS